MDELHRFLLGSSLENLENFSLTAIIPIPKTSATDGRGQSLVMATEFHPFYNSSVAEFQGIDTNFVQLRICDRGILG